MKRTISLILAALMLASTMACGKTEPKGTEISETQAVETNAPETNPPATNAPATDAPETQAPAPSYDTSLITENGIAKAHIVLADNAEQCEKIAAEELVYHIKKVSGAEIAVTNTAAEDSLPIIIATPTSLPELEELFPEDLSWLRTLEEENSNTEYSDDGFAIRAHNGKLYIFGATAQGAMNGVYDFIEENLGVIWIRGNDDIGLICDDMPTVTVEKTDYREKSPIKLRAITRYGGGTDLDDIYLRRNKSNYGCATGSAVRQMQDKMQKGLNTLNIECMVKHWIITSPIYDPNISEYWETDEAGVHKTYESSEHINYWSELTADTIAASVIQSLDSLAAAGLSLQYIAVSNEDKPWPTVYPEQTEPFEYAPGQFISPDEAGYTSTVYFTFMNRIARQVKEKYPDVMIITYNYASDGEIPKCGLDDNVGLVYCAPHEDMTKATIQSSDGPRGSKEAEKIAKWMEYTPNILYYLYWGASPAAGYYERAYWHRMQNDLQYFAESGIIGVAPAYYGDADNNFELIGLVWDYTLHNYWEMNVLTHWLYTKLSWNPYEDVDALIAEFCDKVFGAAAEDMKEYYNLLQQSWAFGSEAITYEYNMENYYGTGPDVYFNYFMDVENDDGVHFLSAMRDALNAAWEKADDRAKVHIRYIKEVYDTAEELIPNLSPTYQ